VDAESLDVEAIADALIVDADGQVENEIERGDFAWSNELARHVIEVKTNGPVASLQGLAAGFADELDAIGERLRPLGARLLPTSMHPWMDPDREFQIWPHGQREIYDAFHRIFDCRGHGWANLQSMHVNLSFAGDDEFGRLHAAIRALLPLLPALAAASPFVAGRHSGTLDSRLEVYRSNARRVPSVSGSVIPEPVFTRAAYDAMLATIYRDLAPFDPEGILCHEWVNARGCIARFDRMAIEIRVLDVQECPLADLAIAGAVTACVRALSDPDPRHQARLRNLSTERLAQVLAGTISAAESARVEDADYLVALGLDARPRSAGEVWRALVDRYVAPDAEAAECLPALEVILNEGCLARRIVRRVGTEPTRESLRTVYRELAECLRQRRLFRVAA
jgi:gamma-glutamyl:cysteine ligase YbdK (ATP-grasp superfamily)